MKDNILIIQESLMRQLGRLDDDKLMAKDGKYEVARANAMKETSLTFMKSCNLKLAIEKASQSSKEKRNELSKYVGIVVDEKQKI